MANVRSGDLWIHVAEDPAIFLRFSGRGSISRSRAKPGRVGLYAGGRRRLVTRPGQVPGYDLTLVDVETPQVETLEGWTGQLVLVRDPVGTVIHGVYFSMDANPAFPIGRWGVSLDVEHVTPEPA